MQVTTQISIPKSNHPIDYASRVVSLGSCFAANIVENLIISNSAIQPTRLVYCSTRRL